MKATDDNKRYPLGATIGILLCFLSFLYLYLGLLVVPILTVIGQLYFYLRLQIMDKALRRETQF